MKFWFDTLRSRLLLTLITYVLYTLLYILTDEQARDFYLSGDYPAWGYAFDVVTTLVCIFFFVQLSICYSRLIYRCFLSLEHPYRSLIVYSVMLLVMNNLTAYVLSLLTGLLFDMDDLPFFQVQHLYVYSILSAFISSIYTNAHYLHSYMDAEAQKKRLEMVAMQAQLAALKQQIDPHFMFNNFSILSELIMEDRTLAVKFLDELAAAVERARRMQHTVSDDSLSRLLEQMQQSRFRYRERFLLPWRDGYKSDLVRDVNHIFSENKLTCLCLTDGTQEVVSLSMDVLEAQLNPDEFFRANRQYIVRIDCVEYVGNYFNAKLIVRLKGYPKAEVIVSREKAAAFKAWMDR